MPAKNYEICIKIEGESISVYVEPMDAESAEGVATGAMNPGEGMSDGAGMAAEPVASGGAEMGGAESGAEATSLPAASIDEAMTIAKQIYDANGQMPKGDGMSVEDAFAQGFAGEEQVA